MSGNGLFGCHDAIAIYSFDCCGSAGPERLDPFLELPRADGVSMSFEFFFFMSGANTSYSRLEPAGKKLEMCPAPN